MYVPGDENECAASQDAAVRFVTVVPFTTNSTRVSVPSGSAALATIVRVLGTPTVVPDAGWVMATVGG